MNRRLFIALWPTDETRAALVAATRPAMRACDGRMVPTRNYHVTLAFLGDQPAQRVDRLSALASVGAAEFELVLDRFGHWRGPRVLWFGPRKCPTGLTALAARIRAELDALGIGYDGRDFRPHLTLARKVPDLPDLAAPDPVHWPVRGFDLVESTTTPDGPVYEVIRRFGAGSRHDPNQG